MCTSECDCMLRRRRCHARAQAALPVGGLARAAERVVLAGLKAAAAGILADDEELRRRVIIVSGSVTPAEMAARLGALGHRAGAAIERTLAAKGRLGSHVAVVTGPFPVIITTNWDELLEAGYRLLRYCEGQITCPGRCVGGARARGAVRPTLYILRARSTAEYIHGRQGEGLAVRYRKDVAQLFAEIKCGLQPCRWVASTPHVRGVGCARCVRHFLVSQAVEAAR